MRTKTIHAVITALSPNEAMGKFLDRLHWAGLENCTSTRVSMVPFGHGLWEMSVEAAADAATANTIEEV